MKSNRGYFRRSPGSCAAPVARKFKDCGDMPLTLTVFSCQVDGRLSGIGIRMSDFRPACPDPARCCAAPAGPGAGGNVLAGRRRPDHPDRREVPTHETMD